MRTGPCVSERHGAGLRSLETRLRRPPAAIPRVSLCRQAAGRYAALGLNDNPFRRQRFDPRCFPYLALRGPGLDGIAREVEAANSAEIVGPHGSGKSLLLDHLHRRFAGSMPSVLVSVAAPLRLTAGIVRRGAGVLWFIDRAERSPGAELACLGALLRSGRRRAVLAVHRSMGLRRLPMEPADHALFAAVVREALRRDGVPPEIVGAETIHDAWARSGGNIRIGLERLYRVFEAAVCDAAAGIR